jgi:hypothetical protein
MEPSRSAVLASRENRDYQRATGPVYRASFSTGRYRRLTPRFLPVSDYAARVESVSIWMSASSRTISSTSIQGGELVFFRPNRTNGLSSPYNDQGPKGTLAKSKNFQSQ